MYRLTNIKLRKELAMKITGRVHIGFIYFLILRSFCCKVSTWFVATVEYIGLFQNLFVKTCTGVGLHGEEAL